MADSATSGGMWGRQRMSCGERRGDALVAGGDVGGRAVGQVIQSGDGGRACLTMALARMHCHGARLKAIRLLICMLVTREDRVKRIGRRGRTRDACCSAPPPPSSGMAAQGGAWTSCVVQGRLSLTEEKRAGEPRRAEESVRWRRREQGSQGDSAQGAQDGGGEGAEGLRHHLAADVDVVPLPLGTQERRHASTPDVRKNRALCCCVAREGRLWLGAILHAAHQTCKYVGTYVVN